MTTHACRHNRPALARWRTPLVFERRRPGRGQPELTCLCDAVPWPHRAGSVAGCYGLAFCEHGLPTHEHPDWCGERCRECDLWEYADRACDSRI
jgi:hypothetical protein